MRKHSPSRIGKRDHLLRTSTRILRQTRARTEHNNFYQICVRPVTSSLPVDKFYDGRAQLTQPWRGPGTTMAKVFSVTNMKGGVGKTTISVALAQTFAKGFDRRPPAKTLLLDLDAQANASFWLAGYEKLTTCIEKGATIDTFLEDAVIFGRPATIAERAVPAKTLSENLFLAPASPNLRIAERELIVFLARRQRSLLEVEHVVSDLLERELHSLSQTYDVIVIDTAPGISAFAEAAIRLSHAIIVPTVPDFISNLGLLSFCRSVSWSGARSQGAAKRIPWVVANKVRSTPHHQKMIKQMRAEAESEDREFSMFSTLVPSSPRIDEIASDLDLDGALDFGDENAGIFAALSTEALEIAQASAQTATSNAK